MDFSRIEIHKDTTISKSELPRLPAEFEESQLGYPKEGELAQYRGPNGLHVHEFRRDWVFHRDFFDPRSPLGAIGHAIKDAPEVGVGAAVATTVGVVVYRNRKDKSKSPELEALGAAALTGFVGWGLTKLLLDE